MNALGKLIVTLLFFSSCSKTDFSGSNPTSPSKQKAPDVENGGIGADAGETPKPIDEKELLFSSGQAFSQDPSGCHWTRPFRRELTNPSAMDSSPQSCSESEYMAGMSYSATTGGDDGIAALYCCKIPKATVPGFQKTDCQDGPTVSNGEMHICPNNFYLAQVDYASKVSATDLAGLVIPRCCSASSQLKIRALDCKQSEWFAGIEHQDEKQCDSGYYINGISYKSDHSSAKRGAMRINCCKP